MQAANIRDYLVIPILRMAQNSDRVEVLRDNSLLDIGRNIDGVRE